MQTPLNKKKETDISELDIFGISAASRLTGISAHVLRIWERRYEVVDPNRTDSKRRQYTRADIRRLSLVKTLVDQKQAIRNVAALTDEQLEQRVRETEAVEAAMGGLKSNNSPQRFAFVGTTSRDIARETADTSERLNLVGEFSSVDEMRESLQSGAIDFLVIELPTLFPKTVDDIKKTIREIKAQRAIVICRFSNVKADKLDDTVSLLMGPIGNSEFQRACLPNERPASPSIGILDVTANPPAEIPSGESTAPLSRKFSDEALLRIARQSSVVKCECPQHLANLLSGLAAFEQYSLECESQNAEDAKLHAYLYQTTAECRVTMEEALERVIKAENIVLE